MSYSLLRLIVLGHSFRDERYVVRIRISRGRQYRYRTGICIPGVFQGIGISCYLTGIVLIKYSYTYTLLL